jgi:hypothetical protein
VGRRASELQGSTFLGRRGLRDERLGESEEGREEISNARKQNTIIHDPVIALSVIGNVRVNFGNKMM